MPDVRPSEGRLSNRRRTSILITCCLSIFIAMVDSTGVNLALPSISREMGASTSQLQWVIDAYLLVLASLMLLSGSMADRLGRRRIFSLGLLLFGLGSALCSVATGPAMLIATRALQAIGGSMLNPVAMAIITNTYPDARRRARAIGVWGAVVGIGMATGPLLGGLLVDAVNWRAVFWVNIPVVVAALILVHLIVPESRGTAGRRVDVGGQLLGILVMATLSFAIITGGEQGFDHIQVLASAAIGALALAAFILVERHTAEPLLDLRATSGRCPSAQPPSSPCCSSWPSPGSCSSPPSTSRTIWGSRPCTPACSPCRSPWAMPSSPRSRAGSSDDAGRGPPWSPVPWRWRSAASC